MKRKRTQSLDRLSVDEAEQARALVDKLGADRAARKLGVYHRQTLFKAIAQLEISHLSAGCIRSALSSRKI